MVNFPSLHCNFPLKHHNLLPTFLSKLLITLILKASIGGVCRETGDMFLIECVKRDRATLEALIIAHVADGSTIFTDGWSSYRKVLLSILLFQIIHI